MKIKLVNFLLVFTLLIPMNLLITDILLLYENDKTINHQLLRNFVRDINDVTDLIKKTCA